MWPFDSSDDLAASSSSTPSEAEAEAQPPTARQARSSRRDTTRAVSESTEEQLQEQLQFLQPPDNPRNIRFNRRPSPQQRLRDISARRSPSPSPTTTFQFPSPSATTMTSTPTTMTIDTEALKAIVAAAVQACSASNRDNNAAVIEAAVTAAAQQQTAAQQQMRRPTLPPFDANNIDNWIRRVESAFTRLNITDAKIKFANLDEKIEVTNDSKINNLFSGTPTSEKWDQLVAYLKKKHGKTTKQRAITVIEGTERDGRTPSQLWELMKDKAGDITLDDVMAEQLLRRLPSDVRGHLRDKIKGKSGSEIAELADEYFDPDGKLLDKSSASGINAVRGSAMKQSNNSNRSPSRSHRSPSRQQQQQQQPESSYTSAFDDSFEQPEVNAVRFKNGQRQNFRVNNNGRSQSRGRDHRQGGNSNNNNNNNSRYPNNNNNNNFSRNSSRPAAREKKVSSLCFYHDSYGDKAKKCEEPCLLSDKFKSGNARAGH